MKVGDLIHWTQNPVIIFESLGMLLDTRNDSDDNPEWRIVWFEDIEIFGGWAQAVRVSNWYSHEDQCNLKVVKKKC